VKNVNKRKNKNKIQRLEKLLPQQNNIIFETEFQDQGQRFSLGENNLSSGIQKL
jgi:hypothetical protein